MLSPGAFPNAAAFSPDGTLLVVAGEDGSLIVYDARTGHPTLLFGSDGLSRALAFTPDGTLVSAEAGGHVHLFPLQITQPSGTLDAGVPPVWFLLSPHGAWAALGLSDETWLIDPRTAQVHRRLRSTGGPPISLVFSDDETRFVLSDPAGTGCWTIDGKSPLWRIEEPGTAAYARDGSVWLAPSKRPGALLSLDGSSGRTLRELPGAYSPKGEPGFELQLSPDIYGNLYIANGSLSRLRAGAGRAERLSERPIFRVIPTADRRLLWSYSSDRATNALDPEANELAWFGPTVFAFSTAGDIVWRPEPIDPQPLGRPPVFLRGTVSPPELIRRACEALLSRAGDGDVPPICGG